MRKKIFSILCIIMLLVIGITGLVGCVRDDLILPTPDEPEDPIDPEGPPVDPTQVTFYFSAVEYDGANYNGQTGVGEDIFICDLKSNVSVSEGTAMASITLKSVTITLMVDGVAQEPRVATEQEFAKFRLTQTVIKEVSTTPSQAIVKVVFGNFSDIIYYGAKFDFELQADPYVNN